MAQTSSAQREPSMEEILASIRRIIEDSDSVRRPLEEAELPPAQLSAVPAPAVPARGLPATGPEAGSAEDEASGAEPHAGIADHGAEGAQAESEVRVFQAELRETTSALDAAWQAEPADASAPAQTPDDALTQDIGAHDAGRDADRATPAQAADLPASTPSARDGTEEARPGEGRPVLLSDHAGRQVAAAFGELSEAFAASRRRSFDEMAEEMLRPMLQDWLDNNLPTLVERLVREEIERVARGG